MQNYAAENLELQERILELKKRHAADIAGLEEEKKKLQLRVEELEAAQVRAVVDKHKVKVRLSSGLVEFYDGNTHAILPNALKPSLVEIRKIDEKSRTYSVVATLRWTDGLVIENPSV
jgi:predicted  nucleic acid-binding Zn-ribbon protein